MTSCYYIIEGSIYHFNPSLYIELCIWFSLT